MDRKNITGWQIRRIRIAKGLTIAQLSSALPKSSPLSSEQITQIELGTRMIYDHQIQAISQALGASIADLYATPQKSHYADDNAAWKLLAQLEDIISGIEADADNLGINLEEARHWWQKARRLMDRKNLAGARPSTDFAADPKSTPPRKRRAKKESP
jgi:transcriptional regulator with XRE-family HTH domain